jgi:hypothetical protein
VHEDDPGDEDEEFLTPAEEFIMAASRKGFSIELIQADKETR